MKKDSYGHRVVDNFRDVDQRGNIWFELIYVILI